MTYIHELPDWPDFTWNEREVAPLLAEARFRQGRLLGRVGSLGLSLRRTATADALARATVDSAAIEGEHLDTIEVRSSIARGLGLSTAGLPPSSRKVDGFVEMLLDATVRAREPLSLDRLLGWHVSLFPDAAGTHVGLLRLGSGDPMQVVSGPIGGRRVHFEAPPAARVPDELERFLAWFDAESDADPVLRAAIAHLWFLTIHPFEDGNGRIARAICELSLSRADGTDQRFYSLSSQFEAERPAYYRELEAAQRGTSDITRWLTWFLGCYGRAMESAGATTSRVIRTAEHWHHINEHPLNDRQRRVVSRLLGPFEGHLTNAKYAKLAKCSPDTALRDIRALLAFGILTRNPGGGRSTSYRLAALGTQDPGP